MKKTTKFIFEYLLIILGSMLYGFGTVLFVFPHSLILGGTSGVSVILTSILKQTPGDILAVINILLLVAALIVLGKGMALKTLVGSLVTTFFITAFEKAFVFDAPIIKSGLLSALIGGGIISVASAVIFYFDSSSGGTDIIALIIKKYSDIKIGKALLISDVLIVIVGGIVSGWAIAFGSVVGFLVKTLGIDFAIKYIRKILKQDEK